MMISWWCFCTLSPHTCILQTCTITVSRPLRQKSKKSLVTPVPRALPLPQPLEGTHHHKEEKSLPLLLCLLWEEWGGEAVVEGHKLPHPPWYTYWLRWDSPGPRSMWQWTSEYKIHQCFSYTGVVVNWSMLGGDWGLNLECVSIPDCSGHASCKLFM